jgi:hypothetical protein
VTSLLGHALRAAALKARKFRVTGEGGFASCGSVCVLLVDSVRFSESSPPPDKSADGWISLVGGFKASRTVVMLHDQQRSAHSDHGEWKGVLQNHCDGLRSSRALIYLSEDIMRNVYRYQGTLIVGCDRANVRLSR